MQCCSLSRCCCLSSLNSPKILLGVFYLCLHISSLSSSAEIAVIGVLTDVTNPTKCEQIIPTVVYEIESLQWILDLFNLDNYTQNIKLEIDVVDICQPKSSVIRTIELMNKYKSGPKKLIGILSMTTSAKMLNVSWFLSSLPPELSVIQIGTTETAYQLNDRSRYRTFFRVTPDDDYQFQLIAKLLKQLKWNYIAILHEKDVYGEEGAQLLSKHLPALGITLEATLAIDEINEQLFILTSDYSKVQGVVIIAQSWTLERVLKRRISRFRFILTESVLADDSFANLELFENSFAVMRPQIRFPDLERHWESLFNVDHIKQNEIFREMIKQYSGCPDVLHPSCNLTQAAQKLSKMIQKHSALPKLVGLYTFAFLIRKKNALCNKLPCPLSMLKLEDIKNQIIDFSYLSEILHYSPMNLTGQFNEKGTLVYPTGFIVYHVYNNMRNDETGRFAFQEVGQYNGKELTLNNSALHHLEMWGVCPEGRNCRVCSRDFPKFLYREGDIMLFGIVPVRSGNDAINCPCYQELSSSKLSGSQLAEAMIYAVEQLNQRKIYKNLFPGKKIGIVIMDSCNQQIPTFKNLLSFWRGTADICQKKLNCLEITAKTLVYIGALTSEVSIRISQLMAAVNTVQISYASTSSVFRDPLSHEYTNFIRLTPSDNQQIAAMIDICVKMKWLYVSLIYADNAYGRSAQRELLSKAKYSKICVTQSLSFKKGDVPSSHLAQLKRRPDAKVVIVFLNSAALETFMTSLTERMEEREFTFLGSESWGNSLRTERIGEKIVGSISLSIDMSFDPAFDDYLKHKELSMSSSNEWSLAAMESQCYMPLSLNKRSSKLCPANITLRELGKQHLWAPLVIQTVYAAALGLNISIAQICDTVEVCPKLFQKSPEVMEIFKKVKLKESNGGYKRVFDNNGDGTISYAIYRIQQNDKKFVYIKIGKWSQTSGLILDTEQIDVPPLNCPNQKRCSECPVAGIAQTPSKNYIPAIIGFVFLLLLLLVVIFIFWKFSRIKPESNEHAINDLGREDNVDSHNVFAHETNSIEDNRSGTYESVHEAETIFEDPNMEETSPKQYMTEYDSDTDPKGVWSLSAATVNPAYEDDEDYNI